MLLASVFEWLGAGGREAAGAKGHLYSRITHTNSDGWEGGGIYEYDGHSNTCLFVPR